MNYQTFRQRYYWDASNPSNLLKINDLYDTYSVYDEQNNQQMTLEIAPVPPDTEWSLQQKVAFLQAQLPQSHSNIAAYQSCHRFATEKGIADFALLPYSAEANLEQLIQQKRLTETQKISIAQQILAGICHYQRISSLRCVLNPSQLWVVKNAEDNYVPKISHFRLSTQVYRGTDLNALVETNTLYYVAPEALTGGKPTNLLNADLWSYGVLIYYLFVGELPFRIATNAALPPVNIAKSYLDSLNSKPKLLKLEAIPEPFRRVVRDCLNPNPFHRVKNGAILQEYWIKRENQAANGSKTKYMIIGMFVAFGLVILLVFSDLIREMLSNRFGSGEGVEYCEKAFVEYEKGNYDAAIAYCNDAIQLDSKLVIAYFIRGESKRQQNLFGEARTDFEKMLTLDSTNSYAYVGRGSLKALSGDYKGAITDCNIALRHNPNNSDALKERGNAWLALNKFPAAINDYNQAIQQNAAMPSYYIGRAKAQIGLKQYPAALTDLNKAIELIPNKAEPYVCRGDMYQRLHDFQHAILDYDTGIRLEPNNVWALDRRGIAYLESGDYNRAIRDFDQAIRLYPDAAMCYNHRGKCYYEQGDTLRATADYNEAKRRAKNLKLDYEY